MTSPTLTDVPKQNRAKMVMESFRLPPDVDEKFRKRCQDEGVNKTDVLRELVEKWLEEGKR
jgi:predicted DNA-binding protein